MFLYKIYNFWLKDGNFILGQGTGLDDLLCEVHIYLAKGRAVFNVFCSCWCQRQKLSLVSFVLCPLLFWVYLQAS